MKLLLSTLFSALILLVSLNAQNVIILEDDFDTTDGLGTGNNAGKLTIVPDPADSGRGNVGSINIGDPSGTVSYTHLTLPTIYSV